MQNREPYIFDPGHCLSPEEMQAYIQGTLSPEAQFRVEKHLLDCEMCTDEIEGRKLLHETEFRSHVSQLNNDLHSRFIGNERRMVPFYRNRMVMAVASIMLILATGISVKLLIDHEPVIGLSENSLLDKAPLMDTAKATNVATNESSAPTLPMEDTDEIPEQVKFRPASKKAKMELPKPQTIQTFEVEDDDIAMDEELMVFEDSEEEAEPTESLIFNYSEAEPDIENRDAGAATVTNDEIAFEENGATEQHSSSYRMKAKMAVPRRSIALDSKYMEASPAEVMPSEKALQESYEQTASAYFAGGEFGKAEEFYRKALMQSPGNLNYAYYLGRCQFETEQYETAITNFDTCLKDPQTEYFAECQWYKALSFSKIGNDGDYRELLLEISSGNGPFSKQAMDLLE